MLRRRRAVLFAATILALAWGLLGGAPAEARRFLDAIDDADRAILRDLYDGQLLDGAPFGANQNTGVLFKVKVVHEGRVRWALFKPRVLGDREGWGRTPMEVAVFKLDRILGLNLVPPAAYRRDVWVAGRYFAEGALSLFVEDAHPVWRVPEADWHPRREAFSSDLRVLQVLVHDGDHENGNNIVRARHWKDGRYRVIKVDNEAALRPQANVRLEYNGPTWGAVTRFHRRTYERLRELSFGDLAGDLREFLSDAELRRILVHRDGLVRHIEEQVARRPDVFLAEEEIGFDGRLPVGRRASEAEVAKFGTLLARRGVRLEWVERLPGRGRPLGRTSLGPEGIRVQFVRPAGEAPYLATLVEELVHVQQLLRLARREGGFPGAYRLLSSSARTLGQARASMEVEALGRVRAFVPLSRAEALRVWRQARREARRGDALTR
ncbi:MAG: hypothetical protein IT371_20035 [Deltaproteobacteria bacterium]|nr:hypothetical protein [Deltaproteobacteria bacterium]